MPTYRPESSAQIPFPETSTWQLAFDHVFAVARTCSCTHITSHTVVRNGVTTYDGAELSEPPFPRALRQIDPAEDSDGQGGVGITYVGT